MVKCAQIIGIETTQLLTGCVFGSESFRQLWKAFCQDHSVQLVRVDILKSNSRDTRRNPSSFYGHIYREKSCFTRSQENHRGHPVAARLLIAMHYQPVTAQDGLGSQVQVGQYPFQDFGHERNAGVVTLTDHQTHRHDPLSRKRSDVPGLPPLFEVSAPHRVEHARDEHDVVSLLSLIHI